ncbi:MAG: MFS transporter, partial [Alphaproteobacteria bacterium]|nr:MFS transporter [Alphaproteobacteria bacterium]
LGRVLPVIGPALTTAAGVAPENIGYLAGITAGGTMWFLAGGSLLLAYLGPVRLLQWGAVIGAVGMVLSASANWWVLLFAAFAIGVGYGPSPPAGSEILTRNTPKGRRSLIMSIKQSGVPLGGAIAGLVIPPIALWGGWQVALIVAGLLSLIVAALVQPWRTRLDRERDVTRKPTLGNLVSPANLAAPFRVIRDNPAMLRASFAGFCFACVQGCLLTFFVTQLATEIGYSLAAAGAAFSAMQFSGTFARIVMGWLADKVGGPRALVLLAVASAAMLLVIARIAPDWPLWAVTLIGLVAGMTSTSWNGVYLAEIARLAPPGRIGDATAGSTVLVFSGYFLAPMVFAAVLPIVGRYGTGFMALSAIALLAVPSLWPQARQAAGRL